MRTRTFLFWETRFDPQQEEKLTRAHLGSEEGASVWGELKGRNQAAKMLESKWGDAEGRGRLGGQAVGEGGQLGGWRGVVGSQQPQGGAFTQAQLALLPCQPPGGCCYQLGVTAWKLAHEDRAIGSGACS